MSDGPLPKVVSIVLNWNGGRDTAECLRSLARLEGVDHEPLVVDNGSTDGSVELLRREFPNVRIVETGANLGFAGGEEVSHLEATACTVAGNSFLGGWAATAADFTGLDETDLMRPRQPNGGLPVTPLLRLAPGSRAIDAGVPLKESFAGRAPDAGAFEAR